MFFEKNHVCTSVNSDRLYHQWCSSVQVQALPVKLLEEHSSAFLQIQKSKHIIYTYENVIMKISFCTMQNKKKQ
jgi:hypothetical protein